MVYNIPPVYFIMDKEIKKEEEINFAKRCEEILKVSSEDCDPETRKKYLAEFEEIIINQF